MKIFQRVIKVLAMFFALTLSISIITGLVSAAFAILSATGLIKEKPGEYVVTSYEDATFSDLELKIGAAELKVQTGDKFSVSVDKNRMDVTKTNDKLKIEEKSGSWFGWFNNKREVELTIPKNYKFSNVKIETGAGKVSVDGLRADDLKLDLGAGEASLTNLSVDGADIDCGVGKVTVELTGEESDYTFKLSKGIGSIKFNGESVSNDQDRGNGSKTIKIDGGIGEINVKTLGIEKDKKNLEVKDTVEKDEAKESATESGKESTTESVKGSEEVKN